MPNEYQPLLTNENQMNNSNATDNPNLYQTHHPKNLLNFKTSFKNAYKSSSLNILLIFIPFGIFSAILGMNETTIFLCNFISIIPLAKLLGYATEELSLRTSETIGGLLNATFGNAVELIIGVMALKEGLIDVVKASIIGSLLSNLLLVLGLCFFLGGLNHKYQTFNTISSNTSASLLVMTIFMIVLPIAFNDEEKNISDKDDREIKFSRYTSIIMLIVYGLYLVFQLKTHSRYFKSTNNNSIFVHTNSMEYESLTTLSYSFAITLLIIITILISICAEYLVDSIDGISQNWNLSPTFVGLILLPIVGNLAENITAVTVALKNKMDLAIGVAIGSSMQIALMVIPFLVIVGWIINIDLTLVFSLFETVIVFVSVLIVNQLINDGKSNWLEGIMLISAYCIIAIAYYLL
ncbi:calcium/proton exchanger [Piromyces finnis]|uniref:Vacuolar calcium ion transporter n=1 Tax=Piromyces finnis TaxID=1754191 RepID=A0A1Y1VNW5_9FUNG|nr:calcium/proton exchanger [Piromyces finnis]|eukprot:ORX61098.1 calcium/proton exchanger [Piromyces finnis]